MRDRSEFDDLAPLIKLIRAHPPFDRETELVVTRRARKGDKRAQEKLVVHNLSLVISVARKFMGRGVRLEDLVQEGNYGLLKAIEHFDPEKGTHLDRLADEGPTPDDQLLRAEEQANVRDALGRVRKRMGELAWDILSDRLTQDEPRTLEDLGKQWGLSRERVRQVEKSTRTFLSRYLADFDEAA